MTSEMKSTSSNYLGPFSSMAIEATAELADWSGDETTLEEK
jgi:hypothetical protein